ncbi:hypothetical protein DW667_06015 [Coprococcus sp. AM25-15LB]|nr:transposase [Clostridiales bacterium]RGC75358.1 hypothetical protein DW667_06015 [Coprococcus sp. AM25-15LB]RJW09421.1 hypothetical protein DW686_04830 [Coprococcus sp. AM25-4LB]
MPYLIIYIDFPTQYWNWIWINNTIEYLSREIKCRTKAIGVFSMGRIL